MQVLPYLTCVDIILIDGMGGGGLGGGWLLLGLTGAQNSKVTCVCEVSEYWCRLTGNTVTALGGLVHIFMARLLSDWWD